MATKAAEVIELEPVSVSLERMGCTIDRSIDYVRGISGAWVTWPGTKRCSAIVGYANSVDYDVAVEDAMQRFMRRFNDRAQGKPR